MIFSAYSFFRIPLEGKYSIGRSSSQTVKAMLKSKRYLYVGFMRRQVVEKALKAFFVENLKTQPQYIHNLTRLAEKSSLYERMNETQKDFYDFLDPLNIEARYPNEKEQLLRLLTKEKCKNILKKTEEELRWIQAQL
jgi:HEPN domain-containing protein